MKLAIVAENRVNDTASLGGTYWYIHLMLETLRGYDITLFIEGVVTDSLRKVCREQNIKVHLMPRRPIRAQGYQLSFLWELITYNIKLIKFDKVIISGSSDCRMLALPFLTNKSAMILHSQPNVLYEGVFGKLNKLTLQILSNLQRSKVFTVSRSQSLILANNGISTNVINNPSLIDLEVKKNNAVEYTGNKIGQPYLLTIGQMVSYKGIDHWISLVKEFNRQGVACNFVWVGYGEERAKIDSMIKSLRLNNVFIIEKLDDLRKLLKGSLAYFHPSLKEAYNLTLCDSAYLKIPFFCFDNVGDNAEIVRKSVSGTLITEENFIEVIKDFVIRRSHDDVRLDVDYDKNFSINKFTNEFISKIIES